MQVRKIVSAGSVALVLAVAIGIGGLFTLAPYGSPPEPPSGSVAFMIVSLTGPATAQVGQEVQYCAKIRNEGKSEGTQLITFRMDDKVQASVSQTLGSQDEAEVCFKYKFAAAGAHQAAVDTENDTKSVNVQVN
ncbi:hypothetical protein HYR54_12280 [Candidatus Acetothermia bacterium]|nr:hypothetical protein [Candidatus Acetothermia bacterium]MBI3459883.1 hypothetical protein [Candidatus Acetothermia bacterium]